MSRQTHADWLRLESDCATGDTQHGMRQAANHIDYQAKVVERQEAEIDRLREENRHAGNLLAVMHGDGGHYISKHGWAKACEDAEQIRHGYKEEIDRLEAAHKKADDTIADYEQAAARLMCKCGTTVENNNISDYERIITAEIDRLRAIVNRMSKTAQYVTEYIELQHAEIDQLRAAAKRAVDDMTAILGDGPKGQRVSKVPRLFDIRNRLAEQAGGGDE
jgi:DNA mismatch repair ATPase MutS